MESPRRADKSGLSDASFSRPDSPLLRPSDSFAESQQCSADPSAFLGFHVPPSAEEVAVAPPKDAQPAKKKKTFKLVLDLGLDAASGAADGPRRVPSPANPFSELFAVDTQDDENMMAAGAPVVGEEKEKEKVNGEDGKKKKNVGGEKEHVSPPKRRRMSEEQKEGDRSPSPPPTMLSAMDREWRDHRQKLTSRTVDEAKEMQQESKAESNDETRLEDSLPGAGSFSEYSEDLAPRVFQKFTATVETVEARAVAENGEKSASVEEDDDRFDLSAITEDSDRETDFEDDMECTQKLEDGEGDVDMDSKDVTRSYAASSGGDEEQTEAFPYSDTGTQPYGPDSTFMDDDMDGLAENAGNKSVDTSYSVTTRKFECFTPRELNIFGGYSFGIASDVEQISKAEAKDKANLMAFILKACGADAVYENLSVRSGVDVDIVLCGEYTQTCRYYKKRRRVPVKDFQWVTECMILQQFVDPEEPVFEPERAGCEDVFAASAEIGDSDKTTLKLYTGELVMADISGSAADHYLLFNVCEILSIHVSGGRKDEGSQSKRKDKESRVMLRVGMLKREPYNPELSKTPVKVLEISSSQVKRRVVAISKEDYGKLKYKDESIFYLEDDGDEPNQPTVSEHRWLTQ
ncbi:BRCT domain [Phytophthora cinnamomi]|uniref:BRCT domain n=1 Tax=Phytophthora cinnamomi TaxID=4785 RepID=UPI00355AA35F|nr:BRCT domain [Phytophthora cinnamomi]